MHPGVLREVSQEIPPVPARQVQGHAFPLYASSVTRCFGTAARPIAPPRLYVADCEQ